MEKVSLALQQKQRWLFLYGGALLAIALIFLIFLAASRSFVTVQLNSADSGLLALQTGEKGLDLKNQQVLFTELNKTLETIVSRQAGQKRYSRLLAEIAGLTPSPIRLESLDAKSDGQLTLNGFAPRREDLLAFKSLLEQSKFFTAVENPLTNLVKAENINFYLKLTIDPKALVYD